MKHSTLTSMKFLRLKNRLKLPTFQVAGVLELVWGFAIANAQDGGIGRYPNEDIAAWMEWSHDADDLIKALVDSGWVDRHPDARLVVHDWDQHCPNYIKGAMRKKGSDFLKGEIQLQAIAPSPELGAKGSGKSQVGQALSMEPSNLTKPNLTKPNQISAIASCPATSETDASGQLENALFVFPTQGKSKNYPVCQSHLDQLAGFYPGLDIADQVRRALAWITADLTRRKTAKGMMRFLTGWMDRAANRTSQTKTGQGSTITPRFDSRPDLAKEAPRRPAFGKGDPKRDPGDGLWYAKDGNGMEVGHDGETWLTVAEWRGIHPHGWKPEYARAWLASRSEVANA